MIIPESFFYGCPVITTNVGASSEIIINNQNGYIYEIGDYKYLNSILHNLVYNKELLNKLRIGAYNSYEKFSISNYYNNLIKLYEKQTI